MLIKKTQKTSKNKISKSKKLNKERKSPNESATLFDVGTMEKGNDGHTWVIMSDKNNNKRWVPYTSVELNGLKALTVDYLAKNIDKTLKLYDREYGNQWPDKNDWSEKNKMKKKASGHYTILFKPTGNAILGKKVLKNWLKTQQPPIKDNTYFKVEGYISFDNDPNNMELLSFQVDSKNKKIVSSNLINIETFYAF